MASHFFDVSVAERYGVDAAILIEHFRFWIDKNRANEKHFYNGRFWTYNSVKAFSKLFPYWSAQQIRRILERLESSGVIVSGNFNASPWDKTKWYAFGDQLDASIEPSPFVEIDKSLTDIEQIQTPPKPPRGQSAQEPPQGFATFWEEWPSSTRKGAKQKCLEVWLRKGYEAQSEAIVKHVASLKTKEDWLKSDGAYIPAPLVYLNQCRWDGAEDSGQAVDPFAGAI